MRKTCRPLDPVPIPYPKILNAGVDREMVCSFGLSLLTIFFTLYV